MEWKVSAMLHPRLESGKMARLESRPKIKVLIVEGHAAVRRALRKRLGATSDLEVIAAFPDAAAALVYLANDRLPDCREALPDVILLGLQSGSDAELYDTLGVVHKMGRYSTAIIVLAPYADEVERSLLEQAGASSYLLKYIDSNRLIHEIESVAAAGHEAFTPG
jgi:DNA-binding NarL/FixJ family response regulator